MIHENMWLGSLPESRSYQRPFQEPKLELQDLPHVRHYQAYVREYPHKIWPYMVQYLHFRILKFPLTNFGLFSLSFR